MASKAFGSITIVDITDLGELSAYPMSNQPLTVVYNPDENKFTPSFSSDNSLKLTPVIYYNGSALSLDAQGLSINWYRRIGSNAEETNPLTSNTSNGILTLTNDLFTKDGDISVTFRLKASYTVSGSTLTAEGQITFTLIKQQSSLKDIQIYGNNIFKKDKNNVWSPQSITLQARTTNVDIAKWQYYNSATNSWVDLATTGTYELSAMHSMFDNADSIPIKVISSNSEYFDITNIIRLSDGVNGDSNISLVLNNEDQMIPCDGNNNPTDFSEAKTSVTLYDGSDVVNIGTEEGTIVGIIATPSGVTGSWVSGGTKGVNGDTYSVTGWTGPSETASVTFTIDEGNLTNKKYSAFSNKMSLIKVKSGADGVSPVIYGLDTSTVVVNYDGTTFTPSSISFSGYSKQGNEDKQTVTNKFYKIYRDGTPVTQSATSLASTNSYTLSSTDDKSAKVIKVEMLDSNATESKVLDSQNILIVRDGEKGETGGTGPQGEPGNDGTSPINVVLGNSSDIFSVNSSYKNTQQIVVDIPFTAYKGTSQIAASITPPDLVIGSTTIHPSTSSSSANTTSTNPTITSTTTKEGHIYYVITANQTLGSSSVTNGNLALSFTVDSKTVVCNYSWSVVKNGSDGANSVILVMSTPNGYIFSNAASTDSLTIKATLLSGTSEVTSNVTYKWYKYSSGSYNQIDGSSSTLTVTKSTVDSYGSYKCTATYGGKTYEGYTSILDKTDPVQVEVLSTIGTTIKNGQGSGILYCKVTRNGQEISPFPSTPNGIGYYSSTPTGTSPYYLINTSTGACTAQNMSGFTNPISYTWSFMDKDGNPIEDSSNLLVKQKNNPAIYVSGSSIDNKVIVNVEVTV